jgi:uncharacterized membrane protein (UPF0127 family)
MRYVRVRNVNRDAVIAESAGIASNSRERRTGLLKHTCLPEGEGLFIAPCEAIHTFGMKFPIDVLFLDRHRRIVKVRERIPRGRISLCMTADSVLELPAGTAARTGCAKGDQLQFEECPSQPQ